MIFTTKINGIPCKCHVHSFSAAVPMRVYGSGMGDADPPEPIEFDFTILDTKGHPAPWLQKYVTEEDITRLLEEFEVEYKNEYYNPY